MAAARRGHREYLSAQKLMAKLGLAIHLKIVSGGLSYIWQDGINSQGMTQSMTI